MSDFLDCLRPSERVYFVQVQEEIELEEAPQFQCVQEQQLQHSLEPQQQLMQLPEVLDQDHENTFTETDLFDHLRKMDERSSMKLICFKCLCCRCVCAK